MPTLTQLNEFDAPPTVREEGYAAAYDGLKRRANPHDIFSLSHGEWLAGYDSAIREMDQDQDNADHYNSQEDFDSGRWTQDDTDSMERGPDLPMRNEVGEYM